MRSRRPNRQRSDATVPVRRQSGRVVREFAGLVLQPNEIRTGFDHEDLVAARAAV